MFITAIFYVRASHHVFRLISKFDRVLKVFQFSVKFNKVGLPKWLSGKQSTCQCRRPRRLGFNLWVRKISWRDGEKMEAGGSHGKISCLQCGRPRFDSWSGRSPGEGNGNPLQYSCLENPMDREIWPVHEVTERDMAKRACTGVHTHTYTHTHNKVAIGCCQFCSFFRKKWFNIQGTAVHIYTFGNTL